MAIRAVLFDYDGVVADTMTGNLKAWTAAFAPFGTQVVPEDYYQLEGRGPLAIATALCSRYGIANSFAQEIAAAKALHFQAIGTSDLYPEIPEILHHLKRMGLRLALVTGAAKKRLESNLPDSIRALFEVIVTSDDVKETKPDPAPYLRAMEAINLTPSECLVIENAPLGIASAKSAEVRCVAIATTLPCSMLGNADIVLENHADLVRVVEAAVSAACSETKREADSTSKTTAGG